MKLKEFFIGRPIYWALAAAVISICAYLGVNKIHVRNFETFQFILLGLAVIIVGVIITSYKPGERIIRESLDLDDLKDDQ